MIKTEIIVRKRQNLTKMLRRLNRHFGMHIRISWRPLSHLNAAIDAISGVIELNGDERILDPQILAHEYAHFLAGQPNGPMIDFYEWMHPETFFEHYCEVCQLLDIPPLLSSVQACKGFARDLKQEVEQNP